MNCDIASIQAFARDIGVATQRSLRSVVVLSALTAAWPAGAELLASCEMPIPEGNPLADRVGELSHYERMPAQCLKAMFMDCSAESERAVLGLGSAMVCSLAYEALLSQVFDGNFEELLAWWQRQRGSVSQAD